MLLPVPNLLHQTSVPRTFDKLLTDTGHEALLLHAPSGVIHFASPSASAVLGMPAVQGKNLLDLLHPDDAEIVGIAFRDAVIRGAPFMPRTVRLGQRHMVLMTMPVKDMKGSVIELQTTVRDVSEYVALRDQIVVQDAVAAATSEMAKVGGWRLEVVTNELFWTAETRRIHEVPDDYDPTVESAIGFYALDYQQVIRDAVNMAIERAVRQDIELPLITYLGRHIWVRVSITPELLDGSVVRVYGAFQDITEHHLREAQLSTLVSELTKQRDQLEEFAYVISHHLRGPVGNIVSLLDVLGTDDREESSEDTIKHLKESSKLLLDTLEDLTNAIIVRHEDIPNLERLQIEEVVTSVAEGLGDMIRESGTKINTDVHLFPVIEYPRSYFETIIRQLITNSIRFAAPGRPPRIRITTSTDTNGQFLEISDNGLGIDLDKYGEKIFKIRTSFHRGSAGRGVGLFLVRTIVESMGGSVTVHSIIDKGTTFRINFAPKSTEGEI